MPKSLAGYGSSADNQDADKLLRRNSSNISKDRELLKKECQRLIKLNEIPLIKIAEKLFYQKKLSRADVIEIIKNYPLKK
ncbi:hypothetical protein CWO85_00410 [Candidatus Phytoplasma ziziphi]|uniref:Uncharacterized protein n=1 Tax=Ziziphus jujuba witches'-broom phytoplasma TaxID=135727 RepID=A0A660HLT3_ZIZJU|nr:hypothetical protein [Candidatus Phytoplasma ziziphi]AYJ01005.1 hypothetical protein CWO85_00410 [Candidatus Phytoplasma ziziphi]